MFSRFNKYFGDHVCGLLEGNVESWPWFSSSWWKDITSLEVSVGVNWFNREVSKRIGNGLNTKFWHDSWVGIDPLRVNFPRLFSLSNQKEAKVGDLWELIDGVQVWSLEWRRNIFVWENVILEDLLGVLEERGPTEGDNVWWWNAEDRGGFLVKSAYNLVYDLMATTTHLTNYEEVSSGPFGKVRLHRRL